MGRRTARALLAIAWCAAASLACAQGAPCPAATRMEPIDGGTIAYNVAGAGPTVLLIHGLFADKEQWGELACRLADAGYRTIAVDLPGYGSSDGFPLSVYQLEHEAQALHTLMQRLEVERVDLAGNSMGGAIAALYASRYPRSVRSLAFLGSPLGITEWAPGVREAISNGVNPFIPVTEAELDLELQLLFVSPPSLPDTVKTAIVAKYVERNLHYVRIWNIVNLYDDILATTPPPRAPAVIVWGGDDRIYGVAGAQRLHRRIPRSVVHRLPHAGHLLHVENAAEVAPIYVAFLRRAAAAQTKPHAGAAAIEATFVCDAGKRIDAAFVNGPASSVTLALSDGRRISLPQAMSASGARYANANESFVFWNKGDTAFIEENGKTTYSHCTTR